MIINIWQKKLFVDNQVVGGGHYNWSGNDVDVVVLVKSFKIKNPKSENVFQTTTFKEDRGRQKVR